METLVYTYSSNNESDIMKRHIAIILGCVMSGYADIQRMNLFTPYDILLRPQHVVLGGWQATVSHEATVNERSFQADDPRCGIGTEFCRPAGLLQLFQDEQNVLASLKRARNGTRASDVAQLFHMHDDNGEHGRYNVNADIDVHNSLISAYRHFENGISLSVHLPVMHMELSNVRWNENNDNITFEDRISPNIVETLEDASGLHLRGWNRSGVGDMAAIASWQRYFPQYKPLLHNVAIHLRSGLTLPTGEDRDDNRVLGVPFGHDAGVGALVAGNLELWIGPYIRYGFDTELLHHFGTTQQRRVQTDLAQTDFLLANTDCVFKEPGFIQHFTVYSKVDGLIPGLTARMAYQYTRQQEDKLFLANDRFNPLIANEAESLQEWSTHSLVFDATYTFRADRMERFHPYVSIFAKHGFNGERAVLCDSVGIHVGCDA